MGKKDPSLFTIFKLATALQLKPSTLIAETEHILQSKWTIVISKYFHKNIFVLCKKLTWYLKNSKLIFMALYAEI